jgi:hypothetical protein
MKKEQLIAPFFILQQYFINHYLKNDRNKTIFELLKTHQVVKIWLK